MSTAWVASTTTALPAVPSSTTTSARALTLDASRLLAAYAIVWLHTPRSAALADTTALVRFAVPLFAAAATFLAWQSVARSRRSFADYALGRVRRIYVPFLAWSGIYLLFKFGKSLLLPDQANDFPGVELLWSGSFYHLWFMPFILLVTLAVDGLARSIVGRPDREFLACVATLGGGCALALFPAGPLEVGTVSFGRLCLDAMPAALWGVTLAIACRNGADSYLRRPGISLFGLVVAINTSVMVWQLGRDRLAENVSGVALLLSALSSWSPPLIARLAALGPLAYGIYLSHLLFIKTAEALASRASLAATPALDLAIFFFAIIGSTLLAWLLSRSTRTSWLVR